MTHKSLKIELLHRPQISQFGIFVSDRAAALNTKVVCDFK